MGDFGKTSLLVAVVLALVVCVLHEVRPVVPRQGRGYPAVASEYYLESQAGARIVFGCGALWHGR